MRTREGRTLQSLRAVKDFLDANASSLSGVANTGARKRLDALVAALADHAATQTGSDLAAQGATKKQHALRRVLLRHHMAPIARIAKADLPLSPALESLCMPKRKLTMERLAAAAYGMATAAEPLSDIFIAAGLPPDFLERLTAAADAVLASIDERAQNRGARGGATAGITTCLSQGRKIVGVLDAFVTVALENDPALLANWNIVKRVQRVASSSAPIPVEDALRESSSSSPSGRDADGLRGIHSLEQPLDAAA